MKALAILALATGVASADPPRGVAIDVACDAVVPRDELVAALAVELRDSRWAIVGRDRDPAVVVSIDASPCAQGGTIHVAIGGESLVLSGALVAAARVRALALLVAETLPDAPPLAAPAMPEVPSAPPLVVETPPRAVPVVVEPSTSELALMGTRRFYRSSGHDATGFRIAGSRALPWADLRAGIDLGGDSMTTPYAFDLLVGRLGGALVDRVIARPHVAVDLGARAELAIARVRPAEIVTTDRDWAIGAGIGATIATTLAITPSLLLRLELEVSAHLAGTEVGVAMPEVMAPPAPEAPFTGSVALTAGLAIR